jgi:hypothetical protein
MPNLLLIFSAVLYLLHLILETLSSFAKYNFSSLGRHMQGVSLANILAIASRGAVAAYGVLLALIIEREFSSAGLYALTFAITLAVGAAFSFFLSGIQLNDKALDGHEIRWEALIKEPSHFFERNNASCPVKIRGLSAILLGAQFVAIVIAYGLCFIYPQHRLLIISLVPLISMAGTLIQILLVEPRLARMIDGANRTGYAASREFLRARSISFLTCGCALLLMPAALAAVSK